MGRSLFRTGPVAFHARSHERLPGGDHHHFRTRVAVGKALRRRLARLNPKGLLVPGQPCCNLNRLRRGETYALEALVIRFPGGPAGNGGSLALSRQPRRGIDRRWRHPGRLCRCRRRRFSGFRRQGRICHGFPRTCFAQAEPGGRNSVFSEPKTPFSEFLSFLAARSARAADGNSQRQPQR